MLYEYKCKDCGNIFDKSHGIHEEKTYKCETCGSENTFKYLGSSTPVHFQQGGGWTCGQHN